MGQAGDAVEQLTVGLRGGEGAGQIGAGGLGEHAGDLLGVGVLADRGDAAVEQDAVEALDLGGGDALALGVEVDLDGQLEAVRVGLLEPAALERGGQAHELAALDPGARAAAHAPGPGDVGGDQEVGVAHRALPGQRDRLAGDHHVVTPAAVGLLGVAAHADPIGVAAHHRATKPGLGRLVELGRGVGQGAGVGAGDVLELVAHAADAASGRGVDGGQPELAGGVGLVAGDLIEQLDAPPQIAVGGGGVALGAAHIVALGEQRGGGGDRAAHAQRLALEQHPTQARVGGDGLQGAAGGRQGVVVIDGAQALEQGHGALDGRLGGGLEPAEVAGVGAAPGDDLEDRAGQIDAVDLGGGDRVHELLVDGRPQADGAPGAHAPGAPGALDRRVLARSGPARAGRARCPGPPPAA